MDPILNNSNSFQLIISYLHITTIILGVLAVFDFLFKFRRPINFKINYTILISTLLTLDILLWQNIPFEKIVKLSPFINIGIWGAGLYSLSILNSGKIIKWVWWTSAVIFSLNLYNYWSLSQLNLDQQKGYEIFSLKINDNFDLINITRYLQRLSILLSLLLLLKTIRKNKLSNNAYQIKLIKWITLFVIFVFCSVLLNISITYFFVSKTNHSDYLLIVYNLFCLLIFLLTIYRPTFLNNHDVSKFDLRKFSLQKSLILDDQNFYSPFFLNFYYLNKEANIEHFCKENNIEEKEMFNEQIFKLYQMSFSNLINKKRVDYFVEIAKNPKYAQYSIEGLAIESGFNSRTALYKPFKKYHGGTPIDLIESIKS